MSGDAESSKDTARVSAYRFTPKSDLLTQLLALNQAVAAKGKAVEKVTPPGVPESYGEVEKLVSEDCIKP